MILKSILRRIRWQEATCLAAVGVAATVCGCKTFDSTEADLARERELHRELMRGRTPHDITDPGMFSRPRN